MRMNINRFMIYVVFTLAFYTIGTYQSVASTYFVSNSGDDENQGTNKRYPWKTINKVNSTSLIAGDIVLFKRGDVWREQLVPQSGSSGSEITYSDYGAGNKPILLGSIARNSSSDWSDIYTNVWSTTSATEVGNVIMADENNIGVRISNIGDLNSQGEWYYDGNQNRLLLYSSNNPASYYDTIEIAMEPNIVEISNKSHVIISNFSIRYGGGHGIAGSSTSNISILNCDISYIGGAFLGAAEAKLRGHNLLTKVRYGNGIEFFDSANNCLVDKCKVWEIYDAALTNQGFAVNHSQYNICYRNNVIWNCEYSFEFWNRNTGSKTEPLVHDIFFENNTCFNAGYGWGHDQRIELDDPSGRHVILWSNNSSTEDIFIKNNIFFEVITGGNCIYVQWDFDSFDDINLDYNCYFQASGDMIKIYEYENPPTPPFVYDNFTMAHFDDYVDDFSKDQHSIAQNPQYCRC